MFLGLRTAVYYAPDLDKAREWYTKVLGIEPYFVEPFYVGFTIGGYELGLNPDPHGDLQGLGGGVAYWGVTSAESAYARLLEAGASELSAVQDVGGGVKVGIVRDPFGNALGIIENPYFGAGPHIN
jgi:catechol 2,3-dioxygenase-like lactoylglutathione lyase family enzyme